MREMDTSNDGHVEFAEFAKVLGQQFSKKLSPVEIKQAFDYFDKDSSGYICVDE